MPRFTGRFRPVLLLGRRGKRLQPPIESAIDDITSGHLTERPRIAEYAG
jgi:hypothetical protein